MGELDTDTGSQNAILLECCGRSVHGMLWEQTKRKQNSAGEQSLEVMDGFFLK